MTIMAEYLPNFLSFLRIPLAFFLLSDEPFYRIFAICLAMITDFLDGYLARRLNQTSRFGTILDPLADKFFVIFGLLVFLFQGDLTVWDVIALLSRDIALIGFSYYLFLKNGWARFRIQSIIAGKLTTFLQFIVFLCLGFKIPIPPYIYPIFILLGCGAFTELYLIERKL